MNATRSIAARTAMIDAAERIVAERGLGAMALSEVQTRAGQANKSAAHYHFGSRDGLIAAVVEQRMAPVNERRWDLLRAWDERAVAPASHDIAEALVVPLAAATLGTNDSSYARFLAQVIVDPIQAELVVDHLRADSFRELHARFLRATTLPPEVIELRFGAMVSLCVLTLAAWEGRRTSVVDTDLVVADLIACCAAVLDAPPARSARPARPGRPKKGT